jgi:AcrR family transcriptional regulator
VGRHRSPDFLSRLLDAALDVFGERGLKAARIADIADRMGVAHGTVYNYVESKDALFWLLVDRGLQPEDLELPSQLPVKAPSQERVLARLSEQIRTSFALPKLDAAVARKRVTNAREELLEIAEELYDRTIETRRFASAFERSALDLPKLYQVFFIGARRALFDRVQTYVAARAGRGYFAVSTSPEVAARFVVESITFFARHRFRDPDPMRASESEVRTQVIELVLQALVPEEP